MTFLLCTILWPSTSMLGQGHCIFHQAYQVYHSIGDGPKKRLHLVISDHGIERVLVWPICTFLLSCCKDFTSIRHVQTIYYYNQPTSHWGSCQAGCYTQNPNHFKKIFLPKAPPLDSQPNMRLVVVPRQEFATRSELKLSGKGMEGRGRGTDIRSHLVFAFGFFSPSRGGCWKVLVLAEPSCLARLDSADRPRTY